VGTTLPRDLPKYLRQVSNHLSQVRQPPPASFGNASAWLTRQIAAMPTNLTLEEAKEHVLQKIDTFLRERIVSSQELIAESAASRIGDGAIILTFSYSHVVMTALEVAKAQGKDFEVVIVDSHPDYQGRRALAKAQALGVSCTYALLSGLSYVMKNVSMVLLGASSVMANGFTMARAGTALVAMVAKSHSIPVLVCCESIKFSERASLDSLSHNELANPENLLISVPATSGSGPAGGAKRHGGKGKGKQATAVEEEEEDYGMGGDEDEGINSDLEFKQTILSEQVSEQAQREMNVLFVKYDVTPASYTDAIVSDVGMIPPSSVAFVLRELQGDQV